MGNRATQSVRTLDGNRVTTQVTAYAYDAADQLVTQSVDGTATVTNTWSENGALATSTSSTGTRTYVTDLTDELVSLTLEDDTTIDYTHDASGNRTSRSIDGVLDASWAWDDLSALPMRIGEYDSTGTLATSWLADPTSATGASLAQTTNGVSSWLLSDPFANTVATVSTTGSTVSGTRTMNAFGVERTRATGALADAAVGFAGQYLDAATGLYDMRARDYDPSSGRFTATDPVPVPTGMPYVAGYSYAYNNPLAYSDPSGLTPYFDSNTGTVGTEDFYADGSYLRTRLGMTPSNDVAGCWGQNAGSTGAADVNSQFSWYVPPPPLDDGFVMYDGAACAVGSACYENYLNYHHDPAVDKAWIAFLIGDDYHGCVDSNSGAMSRAGSCLVLGMDIIPIGGELSGGVKGVKGIELAAKVADDAAKLRFARAVKLAVDNPAVANMGMDVQSFVSAFREAKVLRMLPGDVLNMTVEQALKSGNSTVRKLLTDGRWAK